MEKLIELLQQIQELAGVAVDALQNAGGGEKPAEHGGGPPHEGGGDKPPAQGDGGGEPQKY